MQKLIVGCGYLGRRVAAKWTEAGDEVFALTRSPARAEEFRARGWRPVVGDVTNPKSLAHLPDVETVLYAVGFDRASGLSQRQIYVEGLQNVLHALCGRVGRFLYISSTSVYGQNQGEEIDESSPCEPTRENGRICRKAEQLVEKFSEKSNILRLSGIYGAGRLLRRVSDLRAGLPISGDPEGWLNLIHVEDAVQVVLAAEERGEPGAVYLVSDDRPIRRREYYAELARLVGVDLPPFESSSPPAAVWHAQTNEMGVETTEKNLTTPQGVPHPSASQPAGTRYSDGLGKRCSNRKIREGLGVTLQYPTIFQGLPQAIGADSEDFGGK